MIPESQADKLLAPIYTTYTDVETTILAHAGDIQLTLICTKADRDLAEQRVEELATKLEEALDDWMYSAEGESLEQIVLFYLGLRQATLAVAESCTGGMIAQRITSVPGSSRSFLGSVVVYSNELKTAFADVPAGTDRQTRRSFVGGSRSAGRRHPKTYRCNPGPGRDRNRRAQRRHRKQARWPRLHCRQR